MHLNQQIEDQSEVNNSLAKILSCSIFSSSPRQQRFLTYIVEKTLAGQGEKLKGYTIAVDVFDRNSDFDPNLDAIVRVEATRLRSKLREYYDSLGKGDDIVIDFPKGGYVVQINHKPAKHLLGLSPTRDVDAILLPEATPSLAIMPFTKIGTEADKDYFADGITDTLISELSRLSGLFIISRHSSFNYRNSSKSDEEIAKELGVQYLLQGSIQASNERVRISVQLINAGNRVPLWSERYDRELKDLFALQDEVALCIVRTLQIKLASAEAERFGHEGTSNIEAHDLLLRGIQRHWQYTPKSTAEAQNFFENAIALDQNYAAAHAWLSRSLMYRWIMRFNDDSANALTQAYQHAQRSVAIDPLLAYAHATLGWVHYWQKEAVPALTAAKKAVALDPNNAEAYLFLAQILASAARGEEALFFIQQALRLNPRSSPWCHWVLGQCYWVLKQYDLALDAWQFSARLNATFLPTQLYLCLLHALLGNQKELKIQREITQTLLADNTVIRSPWLDAQLQAEYREHCLLADLHLAEEV